jgi:hypothetical protein
MEPRNMCLGLCTNEFNPFGSFDTSYSCWPVIQTIYNLPLGMCIRMKFMFSFTIILGLYSSSKNIDFYLQPLIDVFRGFGYDVSKKHNFQMKKNLMWIINDFF